MYASDGNGQEGGLNPEPEVGFSIMTLGMNVALMARYPFTTTGGRTRMYYYSKSLSGTSLATPIAAGMAAIVLDLATRVNEVSPRTRTKIRRPENMEKVLRMMSTNKDSGNGRFHYMAPWLH